MTVTSTVVPPPSRRSRYLGKPFRCSPAPYANGGPATVWVSFQASIDSDWSLDTAGSM
jgi:hypothetical protein